MNEGKLWWSTAECLRKYNIYSITLQNQEERNIKTQDARKIILTQLFF